MQKLITYLIALSVLGGTVFGIFFWFEKHYCLATDFQRFAQNTNYDLKTGQLERNDDRIFILEKRLKEDPKDITTQEELKKATDKKEKLKKQLEKLEDVK